MRSRTRVSSVMTGSPWLDWTDNPTSLYPCATNSLSDLWRSAELTHLCSTKLTQRFKAGGGAFSFQVVEGVGVDKPWRAKAGLAGYACALSTSFQSC